MKPILGQISITIEPSLHRALHAYSWQNRPMALLVTYAVRELLKAREHERPAYEPPTDTVKKTTVWLEGDALVAARLAAEEDGTSYSAFFRAAYTRMIAKLQQANEPTFPESSRQQRTRRLRK